MKKVLFCLFALALLATSCKKDEEAKSVTPTKENLVGSYKVTKVVVTGNGQTLDVTNNDAYTDPCERDDIHKLNADDTYEWIDAGTLCDPTFESIGTWSLVNSATLEVDGEIFPIKSFNGKDLVVSDGYYNGYEEIYTYTKQ